MKNILRTQSSWPLGVYVKGIARAFNKFKYLGGFLHLKPTVGCQISTLIFEKKIMEGCLYKYSMKNILRTAKFLPTWGFNQRYCRVFNWCKCLGGFPHLKPTGGRQISATNNNVIPGISVLMGHSWRSP